MVIIHPSCCPEFYYGPLSLIPQATTKQEVREIIVKNVQPGKGDVFIAIYNEEKQFFNKPFVEKELASSQSQMKLDLELPQGEYAVLVYQDMNGNKKLDLGLFNIPKEPTGFSNNFRPRFSKPQFKDAAIKISGPSVTSVIELK